MKNILLALVSVAVFSLSGQLNAAEGAAPSPAAGKERNLPTAKEVLDKFVKAVGGRAAFEKVHSEHILGKYEMPAQGVSGQLEVFAAQPNKLLVTINLGAIGKISSGFDGKTAWMVNPATGPMLLEGKQKTQIEEQADFLSVLHDSTNYKSMETVDRLQFDGKDCYKLQLVKKSGSESTEFYEAANGLLAGVISSQESPLGPMMVTNLMNQYQKYGSLKLPSKMTQKIGPLEQVMSVSSVEFNTVKDSVFDVPAEVKGLIKQP